MREISFERGVFLALLMILGLLIARLVLGWPEPEEPETARIDYREPERLLAFIPDVDKKKFAGRDILVPLELARVNENRRPRQTRPEVTAPEGTTPDGTAEKPPLENLATVRLMPKSEPRVNTETPKRPTVTTEIPVTNDPVPLTAKGVIKLSGQKMHFLAIDAETQKSILLQEGDERDINGGSYNISKITASEITVIKTDGTTEILKLHSVFDPPQR
jgi:hypothetical protein